ncbi:MAG TPA: DUF4384 domain-containing protein [Anaeromyxobacteraceae bacterium]|nr:DUF4384 domain-containing protein [Anaeromyxobacteraceae bacterium]
MTGACPSDLKLEFHLLDPASSGLANHLAGCPSCRERLERMAGEGEEFRRFVYPATVDAVVRAVRRRGTLRWLPALVPLAAAAGLAFFFWPSPPSDYLGVKGDGLGLVVYMAGPDGARPVGDRESVPAAAALRFQVHPVLPCRLWIVSVDAAGQVSRLFPATGEGGARVDRPSALPGGAVLDGRRGPERIYAVCSPQPLSYQALEGLCRAAAAGGEEAVRRAGGLPGLPSGAAQASLLLEKQP